MLSKIQANQIADGLMPPSSKSRRDNLEHAIDIPRLEKPFALLAMLPAVSIPLIILLTHARRETYIPILAISVGLIAIFALILKNGFYMRRTPFARIDGTSITFFGTSHSRRQTFQRNAVASIRLSKNPNFWRSAFLLSVVADGLTADLWMPLSSKKSVQLLGRALRDEFPDKFEEIIA